MTVLYICNDQNADFSEAYFRMKAFCDLPKDLILKTSLDEAKKFLENQIIAHDKQKHLDFIITDWNFSYQKSKVLLQWIRNSDHTYSAKNFQFRTIPVLLIEDEIENSAAVSDGFSSVVKGFPDKLWGLSSVVKSCIRSWRYELADDLDLIGLDPQTQRVYPGHRKAFISYYRLKVLSRNFVDDQSKKLNYIWTYYDKDELDRSSETFDTMINKSVTNPREYAEKDYHRLFLQHPTLIKGEFFRSGKTKAELIYEPHLYKNGTRKYDEPDYMHKPHEYALRNPEILEIKLFSQKLIRYEKENFYSKAKKSFKQAKRYFDYVKSSDPRHQAYVIKYLGQLYENYDVSLLMGTKSEKEEHFDLIEKLKKEFEFKEIELVSYEELLSKHIKLCNRLSSYNIF
jgi:hypothetical protein